MLADRIRNAVTTKLVHDKAHALAASLFISFEKVVDFPPRNADRAAVLLNSNVVRVPAVEAALRPMRFAVTPSLEMRRAVEESDNPLPVTWQ